MGGELCFLVNTAVSFSVSLMLGIIKIDGFENIFSETQLGCSYGSMPVTKRTPVVFRGSETRVLSFKRATYLHLPVKKDCVRAD